ncbi:MAG TPA: PPK2 family polyphosphate kinase [Acidimicrobiia bacterium]|nr:PPK2 family polyphosphate kinase [Acidimicrobiia bacterium]
MLSRLRVAPGERARLDARDPADRLGLTSKDDAAPQLAALLERLRALQTRLWAEQSRALLVVLQGVDASGKDGAIRRVFSGVNPQGVRVVSFRAPSSRERSHDYLWRVHLAAPARGEIGIWNRSHYEDVVTAHLLGVIDDDGRERRQRHLREFERMLTDEGTTVLKVFLHLSKEAQRIQLQERLDDPAKRWKFRADDLETRARWDEVMAGYEAALSATSTPWAPWYVVPADRRWVRDIAVARLLVREIERMDPRIPPPDPSLDGLRVE